MDDLARLRGWYAEDLRLRTPVRRNPSVVEAFAAVPRERFLGPGPWRILSDNRLDQPFETPDAAPHWLYHDVLVAIDPARRLNNGLPSFWAHNFDSSRPAARRARAAGRRRHRLLFGPARRDGRAAGPRDRGRIRCGAGRAGARQSGALARRSRSSRATGARMIRARSTRSWSFAGSTHPAPLWLERLAEGGRLMMPLTGENWWGFMLRAVRHGDAFDAAAIGWVGIFPCAGGRDEDAATRLSRTCGEHRGRGSAGDLPIRALHRGEARHRG